MSILARSIARLLWPTDQSMELSDYFNVYRGNSSGGAVDYATPINPTPIPAWPDGGQGKVFEIDGQNVGGIGYGEGCWGLGGWGYGADLLEWLTPQLLDGTYKFAAVGLDEAGNRITPTLAEATVTLAGTPRPCAAAPSVFSYDEGTDTLVLTLTKSPDDN